MPRERRLAGRLEALRLPIVRGHADIGHPISLLLYFGTFAVIASLWLIYHRMLSGTYKPAGLDLALIFAYLALVSLIPCATYEIARNGNSETARTTPFSYFALYATMTALSPIATVRTIRRGYFYLQPDERDFTWLTLLRQIVLCAMMTAALGINAFAGPARAGLFLFLLLVAFRLARRLFPCAPSAERLRIRAPGRSVA